MLIDKFIILRAFLLLYMIETKDEVCHMRFRDKESSNAVFLMSLIERRIKFFSSLIPRVPSLLCPIFT